MGQWRVSLEGMSLINAPMGSSFTLSLSLRALDQPLTGKTSVGARAFCVFQDCFFRDRYLIPSACSSGVILRVLWEIWGCLNGIRWRWFTGHWARMYPPCWLTFLLPGSSLFSATDYFPSHCIRAILRMLVGRGAWEMGKPPRDRWVPSTSRGHVWDYALPAHPHSAGLFPCWDPSLCPGNLVPSQLASPLGSKHIN